jgi:hypothetical protein
MYRVQQLPTFVDGLIFLTSSTNFALSNTHNAETRCRSHCYNASSLSLTPGREGISIALVVERLPLQTNFIQASPLKLQMTFMLDRNHIKGGEGRSSYHTDLSIAANPCRQRMCQLVSHRVFHLFGLRSLRCQEQLFVCCADRQQLRDCMMMCFDSSGRMGFNPARKPNKESQGPVQTSTEPASQASAPAPPSTSADQSAAK